MNNNSVNTAVNNANKAANNTATNISKQAQNLTKKGMNTYQSASPFQKVIFFIVLVLFIIFISYIIYLSYRAASKIDAASPIINNDVVDAYVAYNPVNLPTISTGMTQTFSTWIYVKDWNYNFGKYKNILWKGNPSGSQQVHCPSLWLYPLTNSLKVVTSTSAPEGVESCDIQNIPLMSWVHIVYVLNNRTVDIYINGQLERSCALKGIPNITNDPVYMCQGNPAGYYGKLGKTQYFTRALLPNEVADIYQKGPLGNTQYQIQFFTDGKFVNVSPSGSLSTTS